jgi:hypothetical protein
MTAVKIFLSLFVGFITGILAAIISGLLIPAFFHDYHPNIFDILLIIVLHCSRAVSLVLLLFLPIALADQKKISESSFGILMRRYLPFVTLPLAFLFCYVLFWEQDKSVYDTNMRMICSAFCMCYAGLWGFVKVLKS